MLYILARIVPVRAMDSGPLDVPREQKSWLVIRIPYPALDSGWREGKPDAGEWSPELLKQKILDQLNHLLGERIKGRIQARYEKIQTSRPRSRSVNEEAQANPAIVDHASSARALVPSASIALQTDNMQIEIPEMGERDEETGTNISRLLAAGGGFVVGIFAAILCRPGK